MEGSVRTGGFNGDGPSSPGANGSMPSRNVRLNNRLLLEAQKITLYDLCMTVEVCASATFGSMTRLLLKREGD